MRRERVTAAYADSLAARLTEQDRQVVELLDRLRCATSTQLARATQPAPSTVTENTRSTHRSADYRQLRRRLGRLSELRILRRLDRSIGGIRAGSSAYIYSLDTAGQLLASACGPAGGRRIRRPWTPSLAFLAHRLEITELYVRLVEAERQHELELRAFDAEPQCWRRFSGPGGGYQTLKPDAFVRVVRDEYEHVHFVEVDRATESLPALARKCRAYRMYFHQGIEQTRGKIFPKILFIAPSEQRRTAIEALLARQELPALFAACAAGDAVRVLAGEEPA